MSGFIKLHRSILEWEWYDDINTTRLFTHLLLTVNYKPSRYQGHDVPAGSRVGGLGKLAEQTGLSVQSLRTSISRLKSTEELTVQNFGNFSIFTITNWEIYQQDNRAANIETTSSQHDANTELTASKEENKPIKEEKKKEPVPGKPVTVPKKVRHEYPDLFLAFWEKWKNVQGGGGKFEAFGEWKKLCASDRELACNSVFPFWAKWRGENPDASPLHGVRYLRRHRWDEVEGQCNGAVWANGHSPEPTEDEARKRNDELLERLKANERETIQ